MTLIGPSDSDARERADSPAAEPRRRPGRPSLSNEALLDKALDLFLEQGFERTSIDAICATAGMAKRTIYQRYGDKETLFKAALKRAIEEWMVPIETLQALETGDLEETLQRIGKTLVANIMQPEGIRLLRITNAESGRMPEIGVYTYELGTGRTIDYLADLFQRRIADSAGSLGNWGEAAYAFIYLVVCGPPMMTAWGIALDPQTVEQHTSYCIRLFLRGLLRRDAGPALPAPAREAATGDGKELRDENRRLREMLVSSMLEAATLKEELARRGRS